MTISRPHSRLNTIDSDFSESDEAIGTACDDGALVHCSKFLSNVIADDPMPTDLQYENVLDTHVIASSEDL